MFKDVILPDIKFVFVGYYTITCSDIPDKPLHNPDIVSVHVNHFNCMEICDKLRRDLAIFTYIYLDVDEC